MVTKCFFQDAEIEMLTKELQELRDTKDDTTNTDAAKLAQALESEKLGASRAVSQNQQLKQQLTEMENAFVTLVSSAYSYTHYTIIELYKFFFRVMQS